MQRDEILTRMCESLLSDNRKQCEMFEAKIAQIQAIVDKLPDVHALETQYAKSLVRLESWQRVWQALGFPPPFNGTFADASLRAVLQLKKDKHV